MLISKSFKLTKEKTNELLHRLETYNDEAITIFLPSGLSTESISAFFQKTQKTQSIPYDAIRLAAVSPTGSILFRGLTQKYLVSPPFP